MLRVRGCLEAFSKCHADFNDVASTLSILCCHADRRILFFFFRIKKKKGTLTLAIVVPHFACTTHVRGHSEGAGITATAAAAAAPSGSISC